METSPLPEKKPAALSPRAREALQELQQYLSDAVAPLMVYDSIRVLFKLPPEFLASHLRGWAASQLQGRGSLIPLADYLFHSLKKLHLIAELKLLPADAIGRMIGEVAPFLEAYCPEEDRQLFRENVERLGMDSMLTSPVETVHRQIGGDQRLVRPGGPQTEEMTRALRSFNILLDRTTKLAGSPGGAAVSQKEMAPHLLAAAVTSSRNGQEFEALLAQLKQVGVDTRMDQVIRTLGRSLPDWARPYFGGAAEEKALSSGVPGAMRRVVQMAENPNEGASRFREMINTAVEQVNEGSLARGVVMLELAERIASRENLDKTTVTLARASAHQQIDHDRLRQYLERPDKRLLLKKVLTFFPGLNPRGLFASLKSEQKRETRRLLLALLEAHGQEARTVALEQLEASIASSMGDSEWFYQRNLVFVLRHIPRPPEVSPEKEIVFLGRLTEPSRPPALVKEALASLGAIRHEKAEHVLLFRTHGLEDLLQPPKEGSLAKDLPHPKEEMLQLLDRSVSALARMGSPAAWRAVADHALKPAPWFGENYRRISYLGTQDLSPDPLLVERLTKTLRSLLPRRILGMSLQIKTQDAVPLIEALAATLLPPARTLLEEIAKDTSKPAGQAAVVALTGPAVRGTGEAVAVAGLSGDIEVFGLPMLLQTLEQSQSTGTLKLKTTKGAVLAALALEGGKLKSCHVAGLTGVDAFFQLIERPMAASFAFNKEPTVTGELNPARDLVPLLFEGMTRHDELRRAEALVADTASFRPTEVAPGPVEEERDPEFAHAVWVRAASGTTPVDCENALKTDSFRVRRLYATWVQEGALASRSA